MNSHRDTASNEWLLLPTKTSTLLHSGGEFFNLFGSICGFRFPKSRPAKRHKEKAMPTRKRFRVVVWSMPALVTLLVRQA